MTAVHLPAIVGIRPEGWVPAIGLLEGAAMAAVAATPPKRGPGQPRKWDEPTVALRLRLPESLHAALVQAASEHGRSLNDEVLARCRDAG